MRLLVVGTERGLFDEKSAARTRIAEYGRLFTEVHIIVFTTVWSGYRPVKIADNVFVYPTRSLSRLFYIAGAEAVARYLKKNVFTLPPSDGKVVVTAQDPFESGLAAFRIATALGAKLHIQSHTDFLSSEFARSVLNRWRVKTARFLVPRADRLRVVSESLKRRIAQGLAYPEDRIDVLPIFVDAARYTADEPVSPQDNLHTRFPQFKFIVLMASRLTVEKNIGFAIRTIARVARDNPGLGLVIVGRGPQKLKLILLSYLLGIRRRIVFVGWQHNLTSFYRTANAFLLSSAFEGYGMTLVESGLSGLPILTTRVGIAEELRDGEEALICDVGDRLCFEKKLRALVVDNRVREVLRINGRLAFQKRLPIKDTYLLCYRQSIEDCFSA